MSHSRTSIVLSPDTIMSTQGWRMLNAFQACSGMQIVQELCGEATLQIETTTNIASGAQRGAQHCELWQILHGELSGCHGEYLVRITSHIEHVTTGEFV